MTDTQTWLSLSRDQLGLLHASLSRLTISEAVELREIIGHRIDDMQNEAQTDLWDAYRDGARNLDIALSDRIQVDDGAVVSEGDDLGAWVQVWVWVSDEQAGIEGNEWFPCASCGDPNTEVKDSPDGERCPSCYSLEEFGF